MADRPWFGLEQQKFLLNVTCGTSLGLVLHSLGSLNFDFSLIFLVVFELMLPWQ